MNMERMLGRERLILEKCSLKLESVNTRQHFNVLDTMLNEEEDYMFLNRYQRQENHCQLREDNLKAYMANVYTRDDFTEQDNMTEPTLTPNFTDSEASDSGQEALSTTLSRWPLPDDKCKQAVEPLQGVPDASCLSS